MRERYENAGGTVGEQSAPEPRKPGGATLTSPVQRKGTAPAKAGAGVQEAAAKGVAGGGRKLPHLEKIQAAFGDEHDLSDVEAHVGGEAAEAAAEIGAEAYATGNHVAFAHEPDLHTAAHEAAHVVQQAEGVNLYGGVGDAGDMYERQADAIADRVVAGQSAADLLPRGGGGGRSSAVQRKEPAEPKQNVEYKPAVSATPDKATALMGGTASVKFAVKNTQEAPKGTTFHWGGGASGPHLEFESLEPSHRPTATMVVRGARPGTEKLSSTMVHQVPGGPEINTTGPPASVTVAMPVANWTVEIKDSTGKISAHSDRLHVGDTMKVKLVVTNAAGLEDLGGDASLGSTGGLQPGASDWTANGIEIEYKATKPGPASAKPRVGIGAMAEEQKFQKEFKVDVEMSRTEFLERCGLVNTEIDLADRASTAYLAALANAYAKAWKKHTDVLKEQDAKERLMGELILGAALAFVPGGVGGVVGAAMKKAGSSDFMIDGIKDLTKWGLRTAGGKLAPAPPTDPGLKAFPSDPLEWQNKETVRVQSELAKATERLLDWQTKAQTNDASFALNFDPVAAMKEALTVNKVPASSLKPVDEDKEKINFEKGFWKGWLENYGYHLKKNRDMRFPGQSDGYVDYVMEKNVGKEIYERCKELGLPIDQYANVAKDKINSDPNYKKNGDFYTPVKK